MCATPPAIARMDLMSANRDVHRESGDRAAVGTTGLVRQRSLSKPWVGGAILLIGALHLGSSLVLYGPSLASIVTGGVINTLDSDPAALELRAAGFWFVCAGLIVVLVGLLVGWTERRWGTVPGFLAPSLIVITAFGVLIAPTSGFWLFLMPAALAFWKHRHRRRVA